MFGSEIIDEDYDGEPMYSEKSLDPNEVLAPVMNQKIIKNKDGTKTIIKQLEDGRIVREVVDKNGKVIKKTICPFLPEFVCCIFFNHVCN